MNFYEATTDLADRKILAESVEASASYLESCGHKHGDLQRYTTDINMLRALAAGLRGMRANRASFRRYVEAIKALDATQYGVFEAIKIDYQCRIGSEFMPASGDEFLAQLTVMAFAVGRIEAPTPFFGVGQGFRPLHSNALFQSHEARA